MDERWRYRDVLLNASFRAVVRAAMYRIDGFTELADNDLQSKYSRVIWKSWC